MAMPLISNSKLSKLLTLAAATSAVNAEVYYFDEPFVEDFSLKITTSVTIAGSTDKPAKVNVQEIRTLPTASTGAAIEGVSLVVAKKRFFDHSISKDDFCCDTDGTSGGGQHKCINGQYSLAGSDNTMGPAYSIPLFGSDKKSEFEIYEDGIYYVGFLSCKEQTNIKADDKKNLRLAGSFSFKSSHGYLSAMDVNAMYFCAIASLCYLSLTIGWVFLCFKWRESLVSVHYMLLFVLISSSSASLAKYFTYLLSNSSEGGGLAASFVLLEAPRVVAQVCGLVKFGVGCIAAVMISLGYGTAHDSVASPEVSWLILYAVMFCGCASVRALIQATTTQATLDTSLVELLHIAPPPNSILNQDRSNSFTNIISGIRVQHLLVFPEALVFGSLANWGYCSLQQIQEILASQKQHETLKTVRSFHCSLRCAVGALMVSITGSMLLSRYDLDGGAAVAKDATESMKAADAGFMPWKHFWLFDEALPETIFFSVLVITLHSFYPNEHFKTKAMSQQINFDDAELDDIIDDSHKMKIDGEVELVETGPKKFLE